MTTNNLDIQRHDGTLILTLSDPKTRNALGPELVQALNEELDIFEKEVKKIDEVLECHIMAGSADYLLKIVASDNDDFERIHRNFLSKLPGIANMKSNFALRTVFKTTALPI